MQEYTQTIHNQERRGLYFMNIDGSYSFNILKHEKITATFDAILLDNNIIIQSVYNVTPEAPILIKLAQEYNFAEKDKCWMVYLFIKDRSLSNNRKGLDKILTEAYNLRTDINNYRLYDHQYLLTLLNGGISPFDEYYILPVENEIISLVNINHKFWNVWTIKNNTSYNKLIKEDIIHKNKDILQYCLPFDTDCYCNISGKERVLFCRQSDSCDYIKIKIIIIKNGFFMPKSLQEFRLLMRIKYDYARLRIM